MVESTGSGQTHGTDIYRHAVPIPPPQSRQQWKIIIIYSLNCSITSGLEPVHQDSIFLDTGTELVSSLAVQSQLDNPLQLQLIVTYWQHDIMYSKFHPHCMSLFSCEFQYCIQAATRSSMYLHSDGSSHRVQWRGLLLFSENRSRIASQLQKSSELFLYSSEDLLVVLGICLLRLRGCELETGHVISKKLFSTQHAH